MDLSNGGQHANISPTSIDPPKENGSIPRVIENGMPDEFSRENVRNGGEIGSGKSKLSDEEEVSKRFAHDRISNADDSDNSNSDDHGAHKEEVDHSSDTNDDIDADTALEFTEIVIENREVQAGESDNQLPAIGRGDDDSSERVSSDEMLAVGSKISGNVSVSVTIPPHSQLPKPEAPLGITVTSFPRDIPPVDRSRSMPKNYSAINVPAFGKFIREKSNSLSAAITRRISSLKENTSANNNDDSKRPLDLSVTEFNLPGLNVIVKLKNANDDKNRDQLDALKGRISFFSRSNCRDCTAVRSFFKERKLRYVEINIDVFPMREKELVARMGSSKVPQIFFNEKFFGGLVALNSLRNSGMFEQRLKELLGKKCPDHAPALPAYGFDDPEEDRTYEMVGIVRVLRQRLPIHDRLMKMKIVKNCFSGAEMVEVMIQHLDCGRKKAIEIGKELARKHFIHHVFGENEFEDGSHFYRFLEHEPFIPKSSNFQGSTNDSEPKAAATVSLRLAKIMSAILESYASDDRLHLDYISISRSEEFRRYVNLVHELHRLNILALSADEKLAFFLNLYNAMAIHAVIRVGHPGGLSDRRSFYSDFLYVVGGHPYSLTTIKNGILRNNRRAPYSLVKPFGVGDKRLELAFVKVNPLVHFGLCNGTRSSPAVRFFTPQGVESELRSAAREFFQINGMEVDLAKRTVYLTRIIKWFNVDFGQEKEMLKWILNYLDATKAGLLTHLLSDGGPINVVYQNYDWSVNR